MKLEHTYSFAVHVQDESANGFYSRTLQLAIGKLDLKVPRARHGKEFRPALLHPKWKRWGGVEWCGWGGVGEGVGRGRMTRTMKTCSCHAYRRVLL